MSQLNSINDIMSRNQQEGLERLQLYKTHIERLLTYQTMFQAGKGSQIFSNKSVAPGVIIAPFVDYDRCAGNAKQERR